MQTRTQTAAAALMAFAAIANAHITMKSPVPFASIGPNKKLTSSPLTSANYPCQVDSNPASFYSKEGIDNKMEIGKTQTITFDGSAVHGGGSCQLALTTDPQPSASTSWQVIMSIEGGCPSKSGTGTDAYDFTIPDSIKPGDYVFAWTWISKLSGTQEFYMNCAPVTITGGSGKRDYYNETMELFSRDDSLPELTVTNLADINSCKTQLGSDPQFPNPGSNVVKPGSSNSFAPISGSNCVPKGAKAEAPAGGSSNDSGPGSDPSGSSPAPTSSAAASDPVPASGGGVFITNAPGATSSAPAAPSSTEVPTTLSTAVSPSSSSAAASTPAASTSAASTPVESTPVESTPVESTPVSSAPPSSSAPASSPSGSPSGGSGTGQGLTGPCTSEGMFNCVGGTSYQQCASGSWSVMMQMPPTTKCAEGQTMTLWARGDKAEAGRSFRSVRRGY